MLYDPETDTQFIELGVGSGVVVRPGVILTNYHVVAGAERLRVTFASGQTVHLVAGMRGRESNDSTEVEAPAYRQRKRKVSDTGLEPVTSSVSWMRASQLRQSPELLPVYPIGGRASSLGHVLGRGVEITKEEPPHFWGGGFREAAWGDPDVRLAPQRTGGLRRSALTSSRRRTRR